MIEGNVDFKLINSLPLINLTTQFGNNWWLDSGADSHVSFDCSGLETISYHVEDV